MPFWFILFLASLNLSVNCTYFFGNYFGSAYICEYFSVYDTIKKSWQFLTLEALQSFSLSLGFIAAVTYAAELSTSGIDTLLQGLVEELYYGIGNE